MNINFNYERKKTDYNSGYIFKGNNYRCAYIKYKSLYRNPELGTEDVEFYNFQPKGEIKASSLILHGLGSRNIKFLLWLGPHLAAAGVNTSILILPGNYTRVDNNSVSGKSYLYPDLDTMYKFWEHGIVDTLTTIDLLEDLGFWKKNNLLMGYCLGGMISTIVSALDNRIAHTLLMTTGGHIPKILHESPTTSFVRRLFKSDMKFNYDLNNKDLLYDRYERDLKSIENISLKEFLEKKDIHPLLKIDPLSYINFLDFKKITLVDAFFDSTLPIDSRKSLYNKLKGAKRRLLPISHVNWLPFSYFIAKYMLHKVNINDKETKKSLLRRKKFQNPLDK